MRCARDPMVWCLLSLLVLTSALADVVWPIQVWSSLNDTLGNLDGADILVKLDDEFVAFRPDYNTVVTDSKGKVVPGLINVTVSPGKHVLTVFTPFCNGTALDGKGNINSYLACASYTGTTSFTWGKNHRFYYRPRMVNAYVAAPTDPKVPDLSHIPIGGEWYWQMIPSAAEYKFVVLLEVWKRQNTNNTLVVNVFDEHRAPLPGAFIFGEGTLLGITSKGGEATASTSLLDLVAGTTSLTAWAPWREAVSFTPNMFSVKDLPAWTETSVYLRSLNVSEATFTVQAYTDADLDLAALERIVSDRGDVLSRNDTHLLWRRRAPYGDLRAEVARNGRVRIDLLNLTRLDSRRSGGGARLVMNFSTTSEALAYARLLEEMRSQLDDIGRVAPIHKEVSLSLARLVGRNATFFVIELDEPSRSHLDLTACRPYEILGDTGGSGFTMGNTTFPVSSDGYFNLTNYIADNLNPTTKELVSRTLTISTDYAGTVRLLLLCQRDIPPVIHDAKGTIQRRRVFSRMELPPEGTLGLEVELEGANFTRLAEHARKADVMGLRSGAWAHWRDRELHFEAFSNGTVRVYTRTPVNLLSFRTLRATLGALVERLRAEGVGASEPGEPVLISDLPVSMVEFFGRKDDRYTLKVTNRSAVLDLSLASFCANDLTIGRLTYCGEHSVVDVVEEGPNPITLRQPGPLVVTALVRAERRGDVSLITSAGTYLDGKRWRSARLPSFPMGPLCGDGICSTLEARLVPGQPPPPGLLVCCEDCGCPKVVVERTFSDATPKVGEVVNVTTILRNVGSTDANSVIFNEVTPPGFVFVGGEKRFSGTLPRKAVVNFTYDMQAPEKVGPVSYPPMPVLYFDDRQNKILSNSTETRLVVVFTEEAPVIRVSRVMRGEVALLRRDIVLASNESVLVLKALSDLNPNVGAIVRAFVQVTNNLDRDIEVTCVDPTSEGLEFIDLTDTLRTVKVRARSTLEYVYRLRASRTGNFTIDPTRTLLQDQGVNREFSSNSIQVKVLRSQENATTVFGGMNLTIVVENVGKGDATNVTILVPVGKEYVEGKRLGSQFAAWNGDLPAGKAKAVNMSLTPYLLGTYELSPAAATYMDQDGNLHELRGNVSDVFYAAPAHYGMFPKVELVGFLDRNDYNDTSDLILHAVVMNRGEGAARALSLNVSLTDGLRCDGSGPWPGPDGGWPERAALSQACGWRGDVPARGVQHVAFALRRASDARPLHVTLESHYFDPVGYEYAARSFPIEVPLSPPGPSLTEFEVSQQYSAKEERLSYEVTPRRANLTSKLVLMFTPPSGMNLTLTGMPSTGNGTLLVRSTAQLGKATYSGFRNWMKARIDFPESRTEVFFVDLSGVAHSYVRESRDIVYEPKEIVVAEPSAAAVGIIGADDESKTNWYVIGGVGLVVIVVLGAGVYAILSGLQGGGTSKEAVESTEVPDYVAGGEGGGQKAAEAGEGGGGGGGEGGEEAGGGEGAPGMEGFGGEGGGGAPGQGWAPPEGMPGMEGAAGGGEGEGGEGKEEEGGAF